MKIEVLFPEICNLYGDLANIKYLKRASKDIEVINTHLTDEPYFKDKKPDLIYMGTMTENSQEIVIEKLKEYKDRINELINEGVHFLITGNALEIFGKSIIDEDGKEIKCLNIYDTVAKRDMMHRFNSLYVGEFKDIKIVGYKSQFTHSYGENKNYFMKTLRSVGLNPKTDKEGIKINNFYATYIIGPILLLNPIFAKYLLDSIGLKNYKLAYEEEAIEAYNSRLHDYMEPGRGIYYK